MVDFNMCKYDNESFVNREQKMHDLKQEYQKCVSQYISDFYNNPNERVFALHACLMLQIMIERLKTVGVTIPEEYEFEVQMIGELGNLYKHGKLTSYLEKRKISDISQVQYRPHTGLGLFEVPFGQATFNNGGIYACAAKTNEAECKASNGEREWKQVYPWVKKVQSFVEKLMRSIP